MFIIDNSRFDEAYGILDSSFPADELKTYPRLLSDFIFGGMKVFALGSEEETSCVLTVWEFEDFVFIENFAVRAEMRNRGLGSELIKSILQKFAPKTVLLEVETPLDETQKKRVAFYEDKGFTLSNNEYIQPQLRDTPSEVSLTLMFSGDSVSKETLNCYKKQIFAKVYGISD